MESPAVLSGICRTNSLLATDKNKQFGLRATLTYSDGSTEHKYVAFNPQLTDWQFVSTAIVPKKALVISSITVDCAYEKNANTAYFDNISLVKEVAQTMRYDDEGKLISVQSTGKSEETGSYENGDLKRVETGSNGTYTYAYDSRHNMTSASNGTISSSYVYDSVGNQTSASTTSASANSNLRPIKTSKAYSEDGNRRKRLPCNLYLQQ